MKVTKHNTKQRESTGGSAVTYYSIIKSPIKDLLLVADDSSLLGIYFVGCDHIPAASKNWTHNEKHPILQKTAQQLAEYFSGKRKNFSIPLRFEGTEFQKSVWQQIAVIPHRETISYSELAKRAGKPDAIRAAGTITGRNPIAVIVPCHRVIGKNGGMCGFAGGLDRKRYLLGLENPEKGTTI